MPGGTDWVDGRSFTGSLGFATIPGEFLRRVDLAHVAPAARGRGRSGYRRWGQRPYGPTTWMCTENATTYIGQGLPGSHTGWPVAVIVASPPWSARSPHC